MSDTSDQLHNHEEAVNRYEQVVNDDWLWLKDLARRINNMEHNLIIRITDKLFKSK